MSDSAVKEREWDYWPEPEGEPYVNKEGNEVIGFHDRSEDEDGAELLASFEAYYRGLYPNISGDLLLRPILTREASDVECKINGWEEGTFVRCTPRAKNPTLRWQIEVASTQPDPQPDQCGGSGEGRP